MKEKPTKMENDMKLLVATIVAVVAFGTIAATYGVCQTEGEGMLGPGMHHGAGMMGGAKISGRWHHVWMHGLPVSRSKMGFERHGAYVYEAACADCHGERGRGGVANPNYEHGTVPALDELADSMGIFTRQDADTVVTMLERGVDPASREENPPFRGYARFVAQYESMCETIREGRTAARKDPRGPLPQEMPAWGRTLSERDIDAVIAYIIRLYDFGDKGEPSTAPENSTFP